MGASASICDIDDMAKEYEKVKPELTEEAIAELDKTYESVKDHKRGEFFVIGTCRKKYDEIAAGVKPPEPVKDETSMVAEFRVDSAAAGASAETADLEKSLGISLSTGEVVEPPAPAVAPPDAAPEAEPEAEPEAAPAPTWTGAEMARSSGI